MNFLDDFAKAVKQLPDIKLALVLGSFADSKNCNRFDEFSDIDLFIICDNPSKYLQSPSWLSFYNEVACYFNDPISMGIGTELRVVFANRQLADIAIVTESDFIKLKRNKIFSERILARGYKIIKNTLNSSILKAVVFKEDIHNTSYIHRKFDEFSIDLAVIYKYFKRKDYFSAYYAFNRRIIKLLIWSLEEQAKLKGIDDIYFNGRYMSKWLDNSTIEEFNKCIVCNNLEELNKNMINSIKMFRDTINILLQNENQQISSQADSFLSYIEGLCYNAFS